MKKMIFTLLALVGFAQALTSTASFSKSLSAVDSAITTDTRGYNSASYQLTGTWNATVKFEGTVNGTTWITVYAVNQNGGAVDSIATANGVYLLSGNGFKSVRARVSARTSGTVVVQTLATEGSGVVSLLNQSSAGASSNVAVTSSALPTGAATSTKQSDGTQKTQIVDGSGNVIASTSNNLNVQCANCSGSGASATDAATFTASTSVMAPAGAFYQTTATANPLTNGKQGMLQATAQRALFVNLRDASGAEVSVGGGTQYDDDAVYGGDGSKVTMAGVVRRDANTTLAGADGDVAPLQVNAAGQLKVDGSAVTQPVSGTVTANAGTGTMAVSYATTGSGTATGALRVELPTNGTGVIATVGAVTSITNALPAGTNAIGKLAANSGVDIGDVDVTSGPTGASALQTQGTAAADAAVVGNPVYEGGRASAAAPPDVSADGDVVPAWRLRNGAAASVLTAAGALIGGDATNGLDVDITRNAALVAGSAIIGKVGIDQTTPGTTNLVAAVGPAAHDAAISGAPLRVGARARTSDYTAVANDDAADLIATIDGKQVIKPHAIRASTWSYAAASGGLTNTTAATMKAAGAAGIRNCLTGIQVINGHATVSTEVLVRDGAAGTVLHRGFAQAAGGGYAANFDVAICGTAATLMEVVNVTTGSAVYVNAQGYISAE